MISAPQYDTHEARLQGRRRTRDQSPYTHCPTHAQTHRGSMPCTVLHSTYTTSVTNGGETRKRRRPIKMIEIFCNYHVRKSIHMPRHAQTNYELNHTVAHSIVVKRPAAELAEIFVSPSLQCASRHSTKGYKWRTRTLLVRQVISGRVVGRSRTRPRYVLCARQTRCALLGGQV